MDEIFDVVDENDRVIGQKPRSTVHRDRLRHRAVHVLVFNQKGELLLQLRSASKDEYPLCYTSSASGHVAAGESYDSTAIRELSEELGIGGKLEYLTKLPASKATAQEFTAVYQIVSDDDPRPDAQEIASIEWAGLREIFDRIEREPQRFSPPFRAIIEWYSREFLDQ